MSKTVPSANIDIGIRPMIPAAEKRQAPGMRKMSAYGRSGRGSRLRGIGRRSFRVVNPRHRRYDPTNTTISDRSNRFPAPIPRPVPGG